MIENHMVALPQPELDHEERCDHAYGFEILGVHDYDESTIVFEVKCVDCDKVGYIEGSINLRDSEVEWDFI